MIVKKILKNKSVLIYEKLPHVRSVSVGIWFKAGTVNENDSNRGIAHYIEHMLFKGTKNRTFKEIANELDNIGGHLNAFTSKELTCFYARVLQEHIGTAIDVLSDMVQNSIFAAEMMDREKQVVIEEIAMYNDSPDEYAYEKLELTMWKDHPLSHPLSGYKETVKEITKEQIIDFMQSYYQPDNMVISVAGNFDEKELLSLVDEKFKSYNGEAKKLIQVAPTFNSEIVEFKKEIEQTYLTIGFNAYGYDDDRRFALLATSNILGGGMSSKLFQHVREELGLVYTIGSSIEAYKGSGNLMVYAGMNKSNLDQVLECIKYEIDKMKNEGVIIDELEKVKHQLKSGLIMSLESTTSRMNSNARSMLLRNKCFDQDELMNKIDKITIDDINAVTNDVLNWDSRAMSIVMSK